ncbi:hypothetical protein [Brachybacterium vulturis]|uniref:hypothetical protein n=1 Tax=Brachybacterium vulturis TaxID=2017484 RepID=UPI00155FDEE4|nr:hypothetical protein [Brachybacterium vulturis]
MLFAISDPDRAALSLLFGRWSDEELDRSGHQLVVAHKTRAEPLVPRALVDPSRPAARRPTTMGVLDRLRLEDGAQESKYGLGFLSHWFAD